MSERASESERERARESERERERARESERERERERDVVGSGHCSWVRLVVGDVCVTIEASHACEHATEPYNTKLTRTGRTAAAGGGGVCQ
jgi:hypothetical protein